MIGGHLQNFVAIGILRFMIDLETLRKIRPGARVKVFSTWGGSSPVAKPAKGGVKGGASSGEGKSIFEGLVIARKHGSEAGATFTVRTILAGVGVEKTYPVHSPTISKVTVISSPKKVHRSKLYFVREKSAAVVRQKLGVSV